MLGLVVAGVTPDLVAIFVVVVLIDHTQLDGGILLLAEDGFRPGAFLDFEHFEALSHFLLQRAAFLVQVRGRQLSVAHVEGRSDDVLDVQGHSFPSAAEIAVDQLKHTRGRHMADVLVGELRQSLNGLLADGHSALRGFGVGEHGPFAVLILLDFAIVLRVVVHHIEGNAHRVEQLVLSLREDGVVLLLVPEFGDFVLIHVPHVGGIQIHYAFKNLTHTWV